MHACIGSRCVRACDPSACVRGTPMCACVYGIPVRACMGSRCMRACDPVTCASDPDTDHMAHGLHPLRHDQGWDAGCAPTGCRMRITKGSLGSGMRIRRGSDPHERPPSALSLHPQHAAAFAPTFEPVGVGEVELGPFVVRGSEIRWWDLAVGSSSVRPKWWYLAVGASGRIWRMGSGSGIWWMRSGG